MIEKLIFLVLMVVVYGSIYSFDKKESKRKDSDNEYIICAPKILKQVFSLMFWVGVTLFIVFFIFYSKKVGNISVGHLYLAIIFALLGMIIFVVVCGWKIKVQNKIITVYKLFFFSRSSSTDDIEKAEIGSKKEIRIYVLGKVVATIDVMSNNYKKMCRTLEENNVELINDIKSGK